MVNIKAPLKVLHECVFLTGAQPRPGFQCLRPMGMAKAFPRSDSGEW